MTETKPAWTAGADDLAFLRELVALSGEATCRQLRPASWRVTNARVRCRKNGLVDFVKPRRWRLTAAGRLALAKAGGAS